MSYRKGEKIITQGVSDGIRFHIIERGQASGGPDAGSAGPTSTGPLLPTGRDARLASSSAPFESRCSLRGIALTL